jgi:hypothetical protein
LGLELGPLVPVLGPLVPALGPLVPLKQLEAVQVEVLAPC